MKTPLKLTAKQFKSLSAIKKIIPEKSYVHSFLMYDGGIEIPLSASNRYVIAHTNKYSIYEFWTCLSLNPDQVQRVIAYFDNIEDRGMFHYLQQTLPNLHEPYLRAGMFFLLNKYSKDGWVSRGEFMPESFNPLAMANLKKVSFENLMVVYNKAENFVDTMSSIKRRCDYVFVPVGDFALNYLKNAEDDINSLSYDQTFVDTTALKEFMDKKERKVILLYHYSRSVVKYFKDQKLYFVDKYGRIVNDESRAQEVLVANF